MTTKSQTTATAEREAFELAECDGDLTRDGEDYENGYSAAAWRGFQAGAAWARTEEIEKAAELYSELLAAQDAVEQAQLRAAAAERQIAEGAPGHLSICASQDDTMPGFPKCDCGASAGPLSPPPAA